MIRAVRAGSLFFNIWLLVIHVVVPLARSSGPVGPLPRLSDAGALSLLDGKRASRLAGRPFSRAHTGSTTRRAVHGQSIRQARTVQRTTGQDR